MSCCRSGPRGTCTTKDGRFTDCRVQAAAATCLLCSRAREDDQGMACTVNGRSVVQNVYALSCPLGRYPDKRGMVRWAWLRWYGLPRPLAWWLYQLGKASEVKGYGGCGCIVPLKNAVRRLRIVSWRIGRWERLHDL